MNWRRISGPGRGRSEVRSRSQARPAVEGLEGRCLLAAGLTEFPLPLPHGNPGAIAAGPDGSLWFAEGSEIGRRSPDGTLSFYQAHPPQPQLIHGLTVAPDGTVWFVEGGFGGSVGRIDPDGTVTEFPLPLENPSNPIGA